MDKHQDHIQIGQLAEELGISTRTIRYYEEIGLMAENSRVSGRVRTYYKKDVLILKFILKLKELGISLNEMRELSVNYELNNQVTDKILPPLVDMLDTHTRNIDAKINNLLELRKDIKGYRKRIVDVLEQAEGQTVSDCE
jgi:DNA-binding transcriptional MerR regulator